MMSARGLMNNLCSTTRRSSTLSVFLYAISGLKSIWPRWRFSISLAWSNGALLTGGGNRKSFRPSSSHTHKGLANSRPERGGMEMDRLRGERKLDKKEEVDRWGNIDERGGPKEGRWNVEREKKKDGREGEGFGTEEVMTREILRFRGRRRKIREWSLWHDGER